MGPQTSLPRQNLRGALVNSHSEHESDSDLVRTRRRIKFIEDVERRRTGAIASLCQFHDANRQDVQLVARRVAMAVIEGFKRRRRLAGPPEIDIVRRVVKLARECHSRRSRRSGPSDAGKQGAQEVGEPSPALTNWQRWRSIGSGAAASTGSRS